MGDSIFGFIGDGFAVIAADCTVARSIITYKHDEDKIMKVSDKLLLAGAGPVADRVRYSETMAANIKLYSLRSGVECDTDAAAHYCRSNLAAALRKAPYQVNVLIAGHDKGEGPSLYFMDYMASLHKMNFAAHGYAGFFLYALLDRHWKAGLNEEEAKELVRACIKQLHTRFLMHQPSFKVKVVDKNGVRELDGF